MRGRGAFDEEEDFQQQNAGADTEFTLGAGTLVLALGGLVIVCGICFGLGYMLGRRGAVTETAAQQTIDTQVGPQANGSLQKPSATAQTPAAAPEQPTPGTESASQPAPTDSSQTAATAANPASSDESATQSESKQQVRQALSESTPAPQPAHQLPPQATHQSTPQATSSANRPRPAESVNQPPTRPVPMQPAAPAPSASGLWVQVAAVSHVEDAQALTAALRRRGYVVTPRRESDNLIHVRIGPFNTRDEASRWSMKLLNDGYNAEVQ
jgi:DedD protein